MPILEDDALACRIYPSLSYLFLLFSMMKVFHINHSDTSGGAARAAYRIHHAVRASGIDSRMLVNVSTSGDWTVQGPSGKTAKAISLIRPQLVAPLRKMLRTRNPIIHSPSVLPSCWPKRFNDSDADLVHLHWIQGEMLSIADIPRIRKPILWTLHDMWAFCGSEHCTTDHRWLEGYRRDNRPQYEAGFDLNRWIWNQSVNTGVSRYRSSVPVTG